MPERAIATGKVTGVAAWVLGFLDWLGSIPLDKATALLVFLGAAVGLVAWCLDVKRKRLQIKLLEQELADGRHRSEVGDEAA